ncbi:MAG: tetratricopeptide repeat protein [Betaproteobacteria bacterium]|nr:tetratricopeptide repeat protein [Betaproteobacteria bacterium]
MTRKKRPPPRPAAAVARPLPAIAPAGPAPRNRLLLGLAVLALLAAALFAYVYLTGNARPAGTGSVPAASSQPPAKAEYVGAAACAQCHAGEAKAWQDSQHARAMQHATEGTVLGDFADARFTHAGVTTTFFRRDGRFMVNTDGPDGKRADFEVTHTFGLAPLQQYLVPFPGGRLQALGVAWDSRPKQAGGQRWFHLYPEQKPKAGDPLHWTGIDQNWNYQCADCHSTNLRKGYDPAAGNFRTTATDRSVGCESCHGPGSRHVDWARKESPREALAGKGLVVSLGERRGVQWNLDAQSGSARRSRPRDTNLELETCARCHARRGQFSDDWQPGQPFGDAFRTSLLTPGLYYVDGQMHDEVFNYASFLQSRMHAQGVTCSDCHEPHGGKLRAPGNAVCAQCHAPARFDVPAHTRHAPASPGAACSACHMPTTTYMVVDPRHDHSFRIPRPDRSVTLGVPNACTNCHTKEGAAWAAAAVARWFPQRSPGFQTFAEAFRDGDRGAPGAQAALAAIVADAAQPGIVRASALHRLGSFLGPQTLPVIVQALADRDPLVRAASAQALAGADARTRTRLLPRLLDDPVRDVRMESARSLAGDAEAGLAPHERIRFDSALAEWTAGQRFNADRPEANTALGTLLALRGDLGGAEAAYRRAIALDPTYIEAAINLADLFRAQARDADAERTLRAALERSPSAAPMHHVLGLSLVRQQRRQEALAELGRAARLAPADARFTYVYGVALYDTGKRAEALRVLNAALARSPYDRNLLMALVSYELAAGNAAAARRHAALLRELEPGNPDIERMAREIAGAPG